jgi:hypothetical protein
MVVPTPPVHAGTRPDISSHRESALKFSHALDRLAVLIVLDPDPRNRLHTRHFPAPPAKAGEVIPLGREEL